MSGLKTMLFTLAVLVLGGCSSQSAVVDTTITSTTTGVLCDPPDHLDCMQGRLDSLMSLRSMMRLAAT